MVFPTVKRCCYCISLQTAGLMIGLLGIMLNLASFYLYFAIDKTNDKTVGLWQIVWSCIGLLINASWIYGIYKKRPKPMLPFLILAFIAMIILVLAPFGSLFYFSATNEKPVTGTVIFFLLCCLGGVASYLWIIQFSLYSLIKKSTVNKDVENNGV